jgi:hypothetical protein
MNEAVKVGDTIAWSTWCGEARAVVLSLGSRYSSMVMLRSSDGHTEMLERLPRACRVVS